MIEHVELILKVNQICVTLKVLPKTMFFLQSKRWDVFPATASNPPKKKIISKNLARRRLVTN